MTTLTAHAEEVDFARDEGRAATEVIAYDDAVARMFVWASVLWGAVGMLVGALVALQLATHAANLGPMLSYGRLRPLHTNAVIFAFVGNMIFAGIYYSTQRLLKTRLASSALARVHFWGWQAIIVAAAVSLPLGYTQAKEYAELEWPIDLAIAAVWVVFAINFFWTLAIRREKHLYVALWFYIATIVTVAVLHIVNSVAIPVFAMKSYSVFGGAQDALVQWWYGHNAVAFFLTTPVLGIMYYFLPKAADRPVFSYRLSIIHFWSLVFLYIWAGPHHLLYTALPDWAQTLGMIFSLMLWAPSWGGMLNGLLTLRGAWDRLRTDPVLKFFAAGVTFYGMATFEGPLLSIKSVSGLAHYTDWIVGHVHSGALGWNGFMAAGMFYWLVPRLYGKPLRSVSAANFHFYLGTFGIVLYVVSMWAAGVQQGLMWRAENESGGLLYPSFVETLIAIRPMYWTRLVGGTLYLAGFLVMAWNLVATARGGVPVDAEARVPVRHVEGDGTTSAKLVFGAPVVVSFLVLGLAVVALFTEGAKATMFFALAIGVGVFGALGLLLGRDPSKASFHRLLEGRALAFTVLTVVAVVLGGVAEIVPSLIVAPEAVRASSQKPYAALELEGRDVFIAEGCYTCHSQMIRPFTWETARYGAVSRAEESVFDHPFQWGSKRTGPDLARVGGKYSSLWHWQHMLDPRAISPGSNMPSYAHLAEERVDYRLTHDKARAMRAIGVPYTSAQLANATRDAEAAGRAIAAELASEGQIIAAPDSKLVALIGYLQRLGRKDPVEWNTSPAGTTAPVAVAPSGPLGGEGAAAPATARTGTEVTR